MVIQRLTSSFIRHQRSGKIFIRAFHLPRHIFHCSKETRASFPQIRSREIMKLFTDQGNPFTLKVLSAFNVVEKNVEIEIVDRKSKILFFIFGKWFAYIFRNDITYILKYLTPSHPRCHTLSQTIRFLH